MSIVFEKDEYVIYEARKHWFLLATDIFVVSIFLLLPLIVYAVLSFLPVTIVVDGNPLSLIVFLFSIWMLGLWMTIVILWTDYYLDVLVITNKRVIDIEQRGLFHREISYFELEKIQDIKSEIEGFLATLLKFGDLHIQTAGHQREFLIKAIKSPDIAREKLDYAIRSFKKNI